MGEVMMGMTIDEIIKYLPAPICGSTVIDSEKQKEYEAHDTAVIIMRNYQEMQNILDKIRAEIQALSPKPTAFDVVDGNPIKDAVWETIADVLTIIDKYKVEVEPQESENNNDTD